MKNRHTPPAPIAVSAGTKYSNTPESDLQHMVMHTVTMSDGSNRELMATDPVDAINRANKGGGTHVK